MPELTEVIKGLRPVSFDWIDKDTFERIAGRRFEHSTSQRLFDQQLDETSMSHGQTVTASLCNGGIKHVLRYLRQR